MEMPEFVREPVVDVRGPHPVLVWGIHAVELTGAPRDISVEEACLLAEELTS